MCDLDPIIDLTVDAMNFHPETSVAGVTPVRLTICTNIHVFTLHTLQGFLYHKVFIEKHCQAEGMTSGALRGLHNRDKQAKVRWLSLKGQGNCNSGYHFKRVM